MALPAGRLHIPRRQNWLLPCQRAAVRFFDSGCCALSAVTHGAAELIGCVRDYRMLSERLRADIGKTGFFQSNVAGRAAIDGSELWKPYLLDPRVKMTLQCDRVSARSNQRQILILVVTPFTEVILRRCDGQRN